jgi:hypothetical protein
MSELRFDIEQLEERIAPCMSGGGSLVYIGEINIGGNDNVQTSVVGDNNNSQNQGSGSSTAFQVPAI